MASRSRAGNKTFKLINVHCICHRLALACGDANDTISYIKQVEKVLLQVWSFFYNSAKKSTAYAKAVLAVKQLSVSNRGKKKLRKQFQRVSAEVGGYQPKSNRRSLQGLWSIPPNTLSFQNWRCNCYWSTTANKQLKVSWHSILAARSTPYTWPPEQKFPTRGSLFSIHCSSDRVHSWSSWWSWSTARELGKIDRKFVREWETSEMRTTNHVSSNGGTT